MVEGASAESLNFTLEIAEANAIGAADPTSPLRDTSLLVVSLNSLASAFTCGSLPYLLSNSSVDICMSSCTSELPNSFILS